MHEYKVPLVSSLLCCAHPPPSFPLLCYAGHALPRVLLSGCRALLLLSISLSCKSTDKQDHLGSLGRRRTDVSRKRKGQGCLDRGHDRHQGGSERAGGRDYPHCGRQQQSVPRDPGGRQAVQASCGSGRRPGLGSSGRLAQGRAQRSVCKSIDGNRSFPAHFLNKCKMQ